MRKDFILYSMRRNLHRAEVVCRLIDSNTNYEGDTQNSERRKLKEEKSVCMELLSQAVVLYMYIHDDNCMLVCRPHTKSCI